jgi:hypothetical protein
VRTLPRSHPTFLYCLLFWNKRNLSFSGTLGLRVPVPVKRFFREESPLLLQDLPGSEVSLPSPSLSQPFSCPQHCPNNPTHRAPASGMPYLHMLRHHRGVGVFGMRGVHSISQRRSAPATREMCVSPSSLLPFEESACCFVLLLDC